MVTKLGATQTCVCGYRCGTRQADTILAFGMDRRVLGASRMSRKLVEEAASQCGGVVLQGFADIRAAIQMFAEPYAMQQARAQCPSTEPPSTADPTAEATLAAACGEEAAGDKAGATRCPRRGLVHGMIHRGHAYARDSTAEQDHIVVSPLLLCACVEYWYKLLSGRKSRRRGAGGLVYLC